MFEVCPSRTVVRREVAHDHRSMRATHIICDDIEHDRSFSLIKSLSKCAPRKEHSKAPTSERRCHNSPSLLWSSRSSHPNFTASERFLQYMEPACSSQACYGDSRETSSSSPRWARMDYTERNFEPAGMLLWCSLPYPLQPMLVYLD